MKVFEVSIEMYPKDKEVILKKEYVTSDENTLKSVTDYFTNWCEQYEETLIGVREVLTIVQHIKK